MEVTLTFDNGPEPAVTPRVLEVLSRFDLRSTFFVLGSKLADPERRAKAIVKATTHFRDAAIIAEVSRGLGEPMRGLEIGQIPEAELLAKRGW